jgi:hypothetical protein
MENYCVIGLKKALFPFIVPFFVNRWVSASAKIPAFYTHSLNVGINCRYPASGRVTKKEIFYEEKQISDFGLDCPAVGQRTGAGKLRFHMSRWRQFGW